MKPLVFKITVLFLLCCKGSLNGQGTGYVRLEGKQFIDHNGNPFYPLLVNWGAMIQKNGLNYYPSVYSHYGPTIDFECQSGFSCRQQILNQFNNIRSMGFNGIRLFGLYPEIELSTGNYVFNVYDQNSNKFTKSVLDPLELNILLSTYSELLSIAADVNGSEPFYIIINTGGQSNKDENGNEIYSWSNFQPQFCYFLEKLGQQLQNEPLLLAYDFYNEPCYHIPFSQYGVENKEESCLLVSDWVKAIRTYDQSHLTTLGNCWDETIRFDPACLKIDFNSPHFYPYAAFYGHTEQTRVWDYEDQVKGLLYWMGKNMPIPWIIGETGFTANDGVLPSPTWQDNFNGTEAEQGDFASFSVNRTKDCSASGFSWWSYADYFWAPNNSTKRGTNYFGLLKREITTCPDPLDPCPDMYKTPVTTFFSNYGNNPLPPINSANCTAPDNYLDPFNHEVKNANGIGEVTGTVTDQDGNPIGDALVYGWGWLESTYNIDDQKWEYSHYPFYTFTNADPTNAQLTLGEYKIRPFNYKSPTVAIDQKLTNIWITGLGLDIYKPVGGNWGETQLPQSSYSTYLRRINFGYDGVANNQTVSNSQRNLRGGESLLVKNSIVTSAGISEITAKKKIFLDNFRAESGSYVHLYISDYDHCFSYDGLRIIHPYGESNFENNVFNERAISLNFTNSCRIILHPNPANNYVQVQLKGFQENTIIRIFTPEGKEVKKYLIDDFTAKIGTSDFNNGLYILIATDPLKSLTTKFIVTH